MRSIAFVLVFLSVAFLGATTYLEKSWVWYMTKYYPQIQPLEALDYVAYMAIFVGLVLFVMDLLGRGHRPTAEKEVKLEVGEGADLVDFNAGTDDIGYEDDKRDLVAYSDMNVEKDSAGKSWVTFDDD